MSEHEDYAELGRRSLPSLGWVAIRVVFALVTVGWCGFLVLAFEDA